MLDENLGANAFFMLDENCFMEPTLFMLDVNTALRNQPFFMLDVKTTHLHQIHPFFMLDDEIIWP